MLMSVEKRFEGVGKKPHRQILTLQNVRFARRSWAISVDQVKSLKALTQEFQLSLALGDLSLLSGKWYVTHSGLMRLARRNRCAGIQTRLVHQFCDADSSRWVFCATVYKSRLSKRFVGYGDADPSNVSTLVHGAEMRIAETRAVNRALRKAYGIGLCSVEELGSLSNNSGPKRAPSARHSSNGSNNGQPRLRDQLCLLIRQHHLDPALVKAYAADFCGTPSLKEANRDLVQSFVSHLAACAKEDRNMLICRLNSYAQPAEAKP
jgi:hypothetical protein